MTNYAQCEKFPNTTIAWGARKTSLGYRAFIRTVEQSAWTNPTVSKFKSNVVRPTRDGALADASRAAAAAIATGYVPTF